MWVLHLFGKSSQLVTNNIKRTRKRNTTTSTKQNNKAREIKNYVRYCCWWLVNNCTPVNGFWEMIWLFLFLWAYIIRLNLWDIFLSSNCLLSYVYVFLAESVPMARKERPDTQSSHTRKIDRRANRVWTRYTKLAYPHTDVLVVDRI